MSFELDTKLDGKDKERQAQIKIDALMSASTKPLRVWKTVDTSAHNHRNTK